MSGILLVEKSGEVAAFNFRSRKIMQALAMLPSTQQRRGLPERWLCLEDHRKAGPLAGWDDHHVVQLRSGAGYPQRSCLPLWQPRVTYRATYGEQQSSNTSEACKPYPACIRSLSEP